MKFSRVWGAVSFSILAAQAGASLVITTDTVQNGGTLVVNPADELVIHGPTNPMLTMTNWANSSGVRAILVGADDLGDGRLRIENGAKLYAIPGPGIVGTYGGIDAFGEQGYIGFNQNTFGSVVVTGVSSILHTQEDLYIGHYGVGELTIEAFGYVTCWAGVVGNAFGSMGTVSIGPGSINGNTEWLYGPLTVGRSGHGLVTVGAYCRLGGEESMVGENENSIGTIIVSGEEAQWISGPTTIGSSGNGTVNVQNNGQVQIVGQLTVGESFGGVGDVVIAGENSLWEALNETTIGDGGIGTLKIEDGGRFDTISHLTLADESSGDGSVTVTGPGSRLDVDGHLVVGERGHGEMTIEQGAVVTSFLGRISAHTSSNASVIVDGIDSEWNIATTFTMGSLGGTGNLLIRNEGTVTLPGTILMGPNSTLTVDKANLLDEMGGDVDRVSGGGRVNIRRGANVGFEAIHVDHVESSETSTIRISAGGGNLGTSRVATIDLFDSGHFDVTDHGLIVTQMSESQIRTLLKNGRNNGAWNGGEGIISTLANNNGRGVGYALSSQLGSPDFFLGMQVISSDLLLRYTLLGDTDLNGTVNFDDLLRVAHNYGVTSNQVWFSGDFTYDDQVDFNDLLPIAQNYGMTLLEDGNVWMDESMQMRFDSDWQLALTSVPEPVLGSLMLGSLILFRRRMHGLRC